MANINQTNWNNAKAYITLEERTLAQLNIVMENAEEADMKDGLYLNIANALMELKKISAERTETVIYIQQQRRASRPNPELIDPIVQAADSMLNCSGCSRPIFCPIPVGKTQRDMSKMVRHKKTAIHINICNDKSVVKLTGNLNTVEYRQRLNVQIKVLTDPEKLFAKQIINKFREIKARTEVCVDCD